MAGRHALRQASDQEPDLQPFCLWFLGLNHCESWLCWNQLMNLNSRFCVHIFDPIRSAKCQESPIRYHDISWDMTLAKASINLVVLCKDYKFSCRGMLYSDAIGYQHDPSSISSYLCRIFTVTNISNMWTCFRVITPVETVSIHQLHHDIFCFASS